MDKDLERIRQRAFEIWEAEGCPDGREAVHWKQAVAEIEAEDHGSDREDVADE